MALKGQTMSANKMYLGRKRKGAEYREFEGNMSRVLPDNFSPPASGKMKVLIYVKYKTAASDIDNCIKTTLDVLQKKYGFNDNKVYDLRVIKDTCKKGEEPEFGFYFEGLSKEDHESILEEVKEIVGIKKEGA